MTLNYLLYLLAWGGQSTIARALKSIQDQYEGTPQWQAIQAKVSRKAVIYAFGDQDATHADYIEPNWSEIEFRDMANGTYGYGARRGPARRPGLSERGVDKRERIEPRCPRCFLSRLGRR